MSGRSGTLGGDHTNNHEQNCPTIMETTEVMQVMEAMAIMS